MEASKEKSILQTTKTIYWVLFLGLIAFIFMVAFIGKALEQPITDASTTFSIKSALILISVLILPLAFWFPQKQIKAIDPNETLSAKLSQYMKAMIIRFALLESSGLILGIGFLLLRDTNLLFMFTIVLLFFIMVRPTPFKITSDLSLTAEEKERLFGA